MKKARSILTALCLTALPFGAHAQDFYASNDINLVVGGSPGGAFDIYARLLARHLGRHIPGDPNIIVQNMPGAGTLTAVRHLDAIAPTDGTVIVTFNPGLLIGSLTDPQNIPVDFRDYSWLGSISRSLRVCFTWHTTGIENWEDLVAQDEVMSGLTAPGTGAYIDIALFSNVFGVNIRPILGFPGSPEIALAVERGEVDIHCATWSTISDNWKQSDEFVPLVRTADVEDPTLPDTVPFIGTFAETDEQREILDVVSAGDTAGSPFILSGQVPEERLAILREAFDATMEDPEFLAEAERLGLPVNPVSGARVEAIVNELYDIDPALVERVRDAVDLSQ